MPNEISKLLEKGYKEYAPGPFDHDGIETCYQKCFHDGNVKKYFIDIHKWRDMTRPYTNERIPGRYEYSTQLYRKGTRDALDLLFHTSWELEEVEKYVETIYQSGEFEPYDSRV